MSSEIGKGLQVLHEVVLMHYGDRVTILGCNGLSKLVVVEAPEICDGTYPGDLFLRTATPQLLPATAGDLLMALEKYRASLEAKSILLQATEIENLGHLREAYAHALELVAQDGEFRSLAELFIESVIKCSSSHK